GGGGASRGGDRRILEPAPGRGTRGAVLRPHALPSRGVSEPHGVPVRRAVPVGQGGRLPVVQSRHGAVLRPRGPDARAALEPAGRAPLPARRGLLQLPGAAPLQGQVRSRLGAALPGVARRRGAAARPHQRRRAHLGRDARHRLAMRRGRLLLGLVVALADTAAWAAPATLHYEPIGEIAVTRPAGSATAVAILVS